ncbi:helix-turn-helix domain-containing protein [Candidatus Margulisiibacteriota bacterium]
MGTIGARIKQHREVKNMSQQDLSSAAGVSLGLIQQIEQGRHNNPSINVLGKIADVLDVDVIHLIKDFTVAKVPQGNVESLKKKAKLTYIPIFDDIPTDDDLKSMSSSKVKALAPVLNSRADYILHLTKNYKLGATVRQDDNVAIRKATFLKSRSIYLFQTKDKSYHIGVCNVYDNKKAFLMGQTANDAPMEYNKKDITVIGEVVGWVKSPKNDSLPLPKVNL